MSTWKGELSFICKQRRPFYLWVRNWVQILVHAQGPHFLIEFFLFRRCSPAHHHLQTAGLYVNTVCSPHMNKPNSVDHAGCYSTVMKLEWQKHGFLYKRRRFWTCVIHVRLWRREHWRWLGFSGLCPTQVCFMFLIIANYCLWVPITHTNLWVAWYQCAFWKWPHPDNGSESGLTRDHEAGIVHEEKQEKWSLVLKMFYFVIEREGFNDQLQLMPFISYLNVLKNPNACCVVFFSSTKIKASLDFGVYLGSSVSVGVCSCKAKGSVTSSNYRRWHE